MTRAVPSRLTFAHGFTLTELSIVLVIVALLIGGMMLPLSAQDDVRRTQETQKSLNDARDALIGFAVANGRLPCPATAASNGVESFAAGGDQLNGNCSDFYSGFLPAAQLGLGPTNANGLLLDAWNQPIRYAVWGAGGAINGISNPLTRTDGMRGATMTSVAATSLLSACASSAGITGIDCGTANVLTSRAPVLLFSIGKNGALGAPSADEAANLDANPVFVAHEAAPNYDDIVIWLSPNILFNRMIAAGRLP
jgi:prepilin-type N-terminal cleavage/methylation domain-containing protein